MTMKITKSKRIRSCMTALVSLMIMTMIDQFSKWLAVTHLKNGRESMVVLPKLLKLSYLENHGAAWGILKNQQWLFILISIILLLFLCFYYIKVPLKSRYRPVRILVVILASGAIGNMIDRMVQGYVVDFFEFIFISFPVFNVADIYVTCSVFVLLLFILFYYKDEDMDQLTKIRR